MWFTYLLLPLISGLAIVCHLTLYPLALSGEFVVVNKHLLHDLTEMGLWSDALKNKMIYENGSVLNILEIPEELKAIYKYFYFLFVFLTTR